MSTVLDLIQGSWWVLAFVGVMRAGPTLARAVVSRISR